MKKILFFIFLSMSVTCFAQDSLSIEPRQINEADSIHVDTHTLLDNKLEDVTKTKGDSAYIKEDYAAAIQIYEALLKNGEASEVYYNLGNSYYKIGEIAKAVLNYERALLLQPGNSDIRANLEVARAKTIDKVEPTPEVFFISWTKSLINCMSVDAWATWGIVSFILLIVSLYFFIFSKQIMWKKIGFISGIIFLIITVCSNLFASQQKENLVNRNAGIFKHLKEEEIEELTLEIANTRSVTPQVKEEVINEFYEVCLAQQYIAEGGINYAKELLEKALGSDKAMDVIGKLTASLQVKPFEFVRKTDASQLINFIQDEHPQTIALILSYLSPSQAALIISALPPDSQAEVARRIAVMDRTSPDVIKEVEKVLESKLASLVNQDYTIIGGVDAVVDILNTVDRGTEKHIMETLEIEEPELADEIRKKMFVFEDILLLDDKAIQRVLRDVDNNDLAVALKGANEQVQNAIFNNLSKRLVVMIKEDMEFMGPVRMKDVEEAQQKIVNIIRKLEDSGEIIISRGGGDEIVV